MSSAGDKPADVFCVCYKYESSGRQVFINYVSESNEDKSIKFLRMVVEALVGPKQTSDQQEGTNEVPEFDEQTMRPFIELSFFARYGIGAVDVYTSDNGKDLVMEIKIFQDHWELLDKMPLEQQKTSFLSVMFNIIQDGLLRTVGGAGIPIKMSPFKLELVGQSKPSSGEKATKERICSVLMESIDFDMPENLRWQPSTSPIKFDHLLMDFSVENAFIGRTVVFKLISCDQFRVQPTPGALELPQWLLDTARYWDLAAYLRAAGDSLNTIMTQIREHILKCLDTRHSSWGPTFYILKDSKNIIIEVAVDEDHADVFMTCCGIESVKNDILDTIRVFFDLTYLHHLREGSVIMRNSDLTKSGDYYLSLPVFR